jgi:hypothetical protein
MNLEALKKYTRTGTKFDWCGQKVLLRKLSAQDHLDLFGRLAKADAQPDPEADKAATVEFHINIVARTLVDADGSLQIANDASRAWLKNEVAYDDLCLLSELALKHSGYGGAEKKS